MNPDIYSVFQKLGLALALGLIIGVEREREKGGYFAGIRTFPLISMAGCISAMLQSFIPWLFIATFVLIIAISIRAYHVSETGKSGITTEVAVLIAYLLGGIAWQDKVGNVSAPLVSSALAVITVMLLSLKQPLERLMQKINHEDIIAAVQFGVITLIILPIVPNQAYGPEPLKVINPYKIWLMVVLISGVNLIGYMLSKVVSSSRGIELTGFIGGLVSSTAVTLGLSRQSKFQEKASSAFAVAIILASTIMLPRVLFITFGLNPDVARHLVLPISVIVAVSLLVCLIIWKTSQNEDKTEFSGLEHRNPLELWHAIQFGLLFGLILFVAKAAQEYGKNDGVYISSLIAGATEVDALVISLCDLAKADVSATPLAANVAAKGIILAIVSNSFVKGMIAVILGTKALRRKTTPAFLITIVTGVIAAYYLIK